MLIAERFISSLVQIHGKQHPVSTDGGTWYPQACRFLNVDHHIHSSLEKSLIERERCSTLKTEQKVLTIIFHAS
jgi:transposase-like protein